MGGMVQKSVEILGRREWEVQKNKKVEGMGNQGFKKLFLLDLQAIAFKLVIVKFPK